MRHLICALLLAAPDYLYAGIRCEEPEMARLQSAPVAYDAHIRGHDAVGPVGADEVGRPVGAGARARRHALALQALPDLVADAVGS